MRKQIKKKTKLNCSDTIRVRETTTPNIKYPLAGEDGHLHPFYKKLLANFELEEIQYYAGMMDGDGSFALDTRKGKIKPLIKMQINLTEEAAEPIIQLADKLDCTLSRIEFSEEYKIKNPSRRNTKPWYYLAIPKQKAWFFLYLIYPYLLEKKETAKKLFMYKYKDFLETNNESKIHQRQFSYPYLAGYADAEGSYQYKLIKGKFNFAFRISSTNIGHIDYIGNTLLKLGYPVNLSKVNKIHLYGKRVKDQKNVNVASLQGLKKLYKNLMPFAKIKRKLRAMSMTCFYVDYLSPHFKKKNLKGLKREVE